MVNVNMMSVGSGGGNGRFLCRRVLLHVASGGELWQRQDDGRRERAAMGRGGSSVAACRK